MRKYRTLLVAAILIAAGALGGGAYAALSMQRATEAAENRMAAMAEVDAFLSAPRADGFTNTEAAELMAQTAPQVLHAPAKYTYQAPEGFLMLSHSNAWNEAKLQTLYEELKKNKHGEEMDYLFEVVVYPQEDDRALATHRSVDRSVKWVVPIPAFSEMTFVFNSTFGVISLYGGDVSTTVESMAASLSHEYGHHYTFYHMFRDYDDTTISGREALTDSEYAKIRNLPSDKVKTAMDDRDFYYENHHWYLVEVAAEDYVLLMGSPTVKQAVDFPDVRQVLAGAKYPDKQELKRAHNAYPQDNLMIPLATDVPGLAEYFCGFIGETPKAVPAKQEINLHIKRGSTSYQLTTGYREFVYYDITWNMPYEGATYTLVCYDESEYYIRPIKTVMPGEKASATIGAVTRASSTQIAWQYDSIDKGQKTFYVTAMLPDGTVMISNPLAYRF